MRCKSKARKLTQNDDDDVQATASVQESLTSDASEDERAEYGDDEADEEVLLAACSSDDDNDGNSGGGGRSSFGGPLSMATRPASSALCLLEDASLPNELELRESQVHGLGVWSRVHIAVGKKFGPFLGKLRAVPLSPTYAWQVIDGIGRVSGWIDASEPGIGNWMKYVRTNPQQQNLRPFLCKGQIFYQVIQDIEVGEELLLCDKKTLFPELDDLLPSESEDNKTGGDNLNRPSDGGLFDFDFSQHSEFSDHLGFSQDSSSPEPRQGTQSLLFGLNSSSADQGSQNSDASRGPFKCVACDQSFADVVRLDEHMLIDHYGQDNSSGEYKCDQCPKVFSWKSNLIRHQAAHEEGRRYVCENCHKVFTDPSNLQRHIRSQHIGARSHACPECGKTFATSSGLKQHTHIHSSVKPFQCEVCLKSYTQFSNLCRHKRMHADCRMQIKCHKCNQAFSTLTSLSKHKRFCEGGIVAATSGSAATALLTAFSPHPPPTGLHGTSGASTNDKASPMSLTHHSQPGNPLMFYPRPGFSFYPPSLVAYPMFSGATAGLPPHPSLLAANSLLLPTSAKKPDSPDSSQATGSGTSQTMNGSVHTEAAKKEKRTSEGSESEISDDVSSAGISDDVDMSTGSELDSESEGDRLIVKEKKSSPISKSSPQMEPMRGGLVISPREHSPKQAAIYPELKDSIITNGMLKSLTVSCPPADMPFDLSVSSKAHAQHMSPAAKPATESTKEDEPLDLRVDHKKAPKIEENPLHKTHVFGEKKEIPERCTPVTPVSIHETPLSPNKFQMAHPRPIHPLLVNPQLYKPKYPAFPTSEPMMMPLPPRYPFLGSLMNGLNGSASAFDMIRSQMEKMGKPYQDVLAPHVNKLKERYSCKFCGKIFPRSANLTRHLRTHTGEQPYKCKYCERSFSISSNLQRHVRNIHNKEKPFKCPLCDRCFGQQTNLDRHLKKHESDGPTILDDSPKSSDLNEKDETYFDEIRNFIGKVTDHGPPITSSPVSMHPYPPGKRATSPGEEAISKRHRRMSDGNDERSPLSREERESPVREDSPSSPCRTSGSPQVAYEVTMQVNGSDKSVGSESRETSVSPFCNDLTKTMANHEKAVEV